MIMGVYNPDEKRLKVSIQSIQEQTLKDWELLLYDDGSGERYAEKIYMFSQMDRRIRWIRSRENKGLAFALNQCIRRAEGKYIARMDDDDISLPLRLERQCRFLEENPEYGWVGTNAGLIDDTGIWGEEKLPELPEAKDFLKYSPYIHPSVMFSREILENCGGYCISKATRRCEDYELFMRLHAAGMQGYNLQEKLFLYREGKDSYEKRKITYRFCEMQIRWQGFKRLRILKFTTLPYVCRPLAGAVPGIKTARRMLRRKKDAVPGTTGKGKTGII